VPDRAEYRFFLSTVIPDFYHCFAFKTLSKFALSLHTIKHGIDEGKITINHY